MRSLAILMIFFAWPHANELAAQNLSMTGGNQTLNITTGVPGGEPVSVLNVSSGIRYRRQTVITKITVSTVCPGQKFGLKVVATAVPAGTAAPEVTLTNGMLAQNIITDIPVRPPPGNVNATLNYTASARFTDGNSAELGNDVHTVTYTLIAQ